jgi:hypothetical protein
MWRTGKIIQWKIDELLVTMACCSLWLQMENMAFKYGR